MRCPNSKIVSSRGFPRFTGKRSSEVDKPHQSVHQVRDITEAAGLRTVAENGQRLAPQRLIQECGNHAAIVQGHPRAVGIKDPCDFVRTPKLREYAMVIASA